jgi:hypothetical protein
MNGTRRIHAVGQIPDLRGAGTAYIGHGQGTLVRDFDQQSGFRTYVVFQRAERTGLFLISAFPSSATRTTTPNQGRVASMVGSELHRAALDCGGIVISAMLAGGTLALPPTGFSSVGLAIASSALVATSLRCGMSVGRLWNAGNLPDANRVLDNSEWYPVTGTVIDALDTAEAAPSGLQLIGTCRALRRSPPNLSRNFFVRHRAPIVIRIAEEMAKFTGEASPRRYFRRLGKARRNSEALGSPAASNGSGQEPVSKVRMTPRPLQVVCCRDDREKSPAFFMNSWLAQSRKTERTDGGVRLGLHSLCRFLN